MKRNSAPNTFKILCELHLLQKPDILKYIKNKLFHNIPIYKICCVEFLIKITHHINSVNLYASVVFF